MGSKESFSIIYCLKQHFTEHLDYEKDHVSGTACFGLPVALAHEGCTMGKRLSDLESH